MKKLSLFILVLTSLLPTTALAGVIKFDPPNSAFLENKTASIYVVVDTSGQTINTVSGKVRIPSGLSLSEISEAGTIISLWINSPSLSTPDTVDFSGLITGGYNGSNGKLFKLTFTTETTQDYTLSISNPSILLHDGQGTPAKATVQPGILGTQVTTPVDTTPVDTDPPLPFALNVYRDESIANGVWLVAFSAQDTNSGINYYEAGEVLGSQPPEANQWKRVTSPYILADQSRQSTVYIRAVDRQGNSTIATLAPANKAVAQPGLRNLSVTVLGVIIIVGLVYLVIRAIIRHKAKLKVETNDHI